MLTNGNDRIAVGLPVALRVLLGFRAFAEHIVGVGITFFLQQFGVLQRIFDGLTEHELTAQLFQNLRENFVNHRLTHTAHQIFQRTNDTGAALLVQHLFEQYQSARGGIDHRAVGLAFMRRPVFINHFVFEQGHARAHIRYAQNRFGQAHQRQTFGVGQLVFIEHRLHPARRFDLTYRFNQLSGVIGNLFTR